MSTVAASSTWVHGLARSRRAPRPAAIRSGARRAWPLVAGALTALVVALVLVFVRLQVVRTGYDLSTARDFVERLEHEQRELRLEIATLTSPRRLEERARQLGFQPPAPGQVVREP